MKDNKIKRYIEIEQEIANLRKEQDELKSEIAKYKVGDILESTRNGNRGKVIKINAAYHAYTDTVDISYVMQKILKNGEVGVQKMGMSNHGILEEYLVKVED